VMGGAAPPQQPAAAAPSAAATTPVMLYTRQLRFDKPADGYVGPHRWKRSATTQLERALRAFPALRLAQSETEFAAASPRLIIEATHATSGSKGWSTVSRMTKYLVPSEDTSTVELDAKLMRGDTVVKTFEAQGAYATKKQLLWLLAPWMWKLGVPGAVTADTFRELLGRVQQEGAL